MKITITKKNAIKAVMTEPLKGNQWFHDGNVSKCEVCAVGAVLRNSTNFKNVSYTRAVDMAYQVVDVDYYTVSSSGYEYNGYDYKGTYRDALENKNYMGALSMYFEHLYESFGYTGYLNEKIKAKDLKTMRLALHDFIVAEFPNKFVVKG
jgi:hypothetical protein